MPTILKNLKSFGDSSIGKKMLVAITGIFLVGFLVSHLSGNLLIFVGQKAFNDYAFFLHHFMHGVAIWIARIGLVLFLVVHVTATVQLTRINRKSQIKNKFNTTVQAKCNSRWMIVSGLIILAFILYHLYHFKAQSNLEVIKHTIDSAGREDVWLMVITGLSHPVSAVFYLVALSCLCSHLSHGIASVFQTLGLRSHKTAVLIDRFSMAFSFLIWIGYSSIPVAICFFKFGQN